MPNVVDYRGIIIYDVYFCPAFRLVDKQLVLYSFIFAMVITPKWAHITLFPLLGEVSSECVVTCDCAAGGCRDDQFQCVNSGRCIPASWVCNGYNGCGDWSDERNCSELYFNSLTAHLVTKYTYLQLHRASKSYALVYAVALENYFQTAILYIKLIHPIFPSFVCL